MDDGGQRRDHRDRRPGRARVALSILPRHRRGRRTRALSGERRPPVRVLPDLLPLARNHARSDRYRARRRHDGGVVDRLGILLRV
jgi:hypothetical protein